MRRLVTFLALLAAVFAVGLPAVAADDTGPVADALPGITGRAVAGQRLEVVPGSWSQRPVQRTYQWLRDGRRISGADRRRYRPTTRDVGHRIAVREKVTDAEGETGRAISAPTRTVRADRLTTSRRPAVKGVSRWTRSVSATDGTWSVRHPRLAFHWLRDGRPIPRATSRRYTFAPRDVGTHVQVQVTAHADGHRAGTTTSARGPAVGHRVPARRQVTYSVTTRGHVTADVGLFARLAQQSYADPRGWRGRGVVFRRVKSGGSFTLVLAEASSVPTFSSGCSAQYSCRVGRYVIINQTRWQQASPPWNAAGLSLRDYRHLVVNHETGHWLGFDHSGCPGPGRLAPVMMQQSKGRDGCRFNPWPTTGELDR